MPTINKLNQVLLLSYAYQHNKKLNDIKLLAFNN